MIEARINVGLFRRYENTLDQAVGLLDHLGAGAISPVECAAEIAMLAETNPDIEVLTGGLGDVAAFRTELDHKLVEVRQVLSGAGVEP